MDVCDSCIEISKLQPAHPKDGKKAAGRVQCFACGAWWESTCHAQVGI